LRCYNGPNTVYSEPYSIASYIKIGRCTRRHIHYFADHLRSVTGSPVPGNRIPPTVIDAASNALLKYFPVRICRSRPATFKTSGRVNQLAHLNSRLSTSSLDSKDRLNFSIGYQGGSSVTPEICSSSSTPDRAGSERGAGLGRANIARASSKKRAVQLSAVTALSSPFFAQSENVAAELGIRWSFPESHERGRPISASPIRRLNDATHRSPNQTSSSATTSPGFTGRITHVRCGLSAAAVQSVRRHQRPRQLDLQPATPQPAGERRGQSARATNSPIFFWGMRPQLVFAMAIPISTFAARHTTFLNDDWRHPGKLQRDFRGLRWDYSTPVTELYNRWSPAVGPDHFDSGVAESGRGTDHPDTITSPFASGSPAPRTGHSNGMARRVRSLLQHLGVQPGRE